jgi:hypothetical protein
VDAYPLWVSALGTAAWLAATFVLMLRKLEWGLGWLSLKPIFPLLNGARWIAAALRLFRGVRPARGRRTLALYG